ncbi:MAG TPA: DUF1707 domain-containing protein [Kofleriaceae bacterium]|nr:DUF1707 domain-containing protein [Kofleriaceae bacterium]
MNDTLLTDRRDLVIDRLSSGYAQGLFDVDELEHRLALVHAAQTPVELDALVKDLVPASATTALVPAKKTRVLFGAVERTGPWAVPQRLAASVVCGHLLLDLREARLAPGETTIEVSVTMGNVEVIVPPGVEVDVDASSFLAHAEERVEHAGGARGTLVRIVGRVRFGNLEVETRRVGETRSDVRRRRRAGRRMQRRAERHARRYWRHARDTYPW